MADLVDLAPIFRDTRDALSRYLAYPYLPLEAHLEQPRAPLAHLGDVREGFQLALRVTDVTRLSELHALARRVLVDWRWLEAEGFTLMPSERVELVRSQLVAFAHAYIALGYLPRLPTAHITYPGRATYADIPAPRTPGETLARIEELETVLTRASVYPRSAQEPERLRRTYGYFEVSAWLVGDYRRRTGR